MGLGDELERLRARLREHAHTSIETDGDTKHAAVAAVLRPGPDGPEVLLIQRRESPRDPWSGHMAFPGGRRERSDPDLLHTAVRETEEEVGLRLQRESGQLLGRLDDVQAVARGGRLPLIIAPFVFAVRAPPTLTPAENEVAMTVWAPVEPMMTGRSKTTKRYEHDGQTFELPGFRVEDRVVWGLTYHMLQRLFTLLRSRE